MAEIFHTVNSGLYFKISNKIIFFDGLHRGPSIGLSDIPAEVLRHVEKGAGMFSEDSLLCFTHLHPDHYDEALTKNFLSLYPKAQMLSPKGCHGAEMTELEDGLFYMEQEEFQLWAMATPHQGGRVMHCAHWIYLLCSEGKCWLLCGDARLNEDIVQRINALAPTPIERVFVNVYHLNTEKEQRLIRLLSPKICSINHLPMPEDDKNHYRAMAREALENIENFGKIEMLQSMSWIPNQ